MPYLFVSIEDEVERLLRLRRALRDFLNKPEEGHIKPLVALDGDPAEKIGDHQSGLKSGGGEL